MTHKKSVILCYNLMARFVEIPANNGKVIINTSHIIDVSMIKNHRNYKVLIYLSNMEHITQPFSGGHRIKNNSYELSFETEKEAQNALDIICGNSSNVVDELKGEIMQLKNEINEVKEQIKYLAMSEEYKRAEKDFNSLLSKDDLLG